MKLQIFLERDEDGRYVATSPTLPGCISEGATRQEAVDNIHDAICGYLLSCCKHGEPPAPCADEEIIEVRP